MTTLLTKTDTEEQKATSNNGPPIVDLVVLSESEGEQDEERQQQPHQHQHQHHQQHQPTNVIIKNLPAEFTDKDLISLFSQYGSILSANVMRNVKTGSSRGFGFVLFSDETSAVKAITDGQSVTLPARFSSSSSSPNGNRLQVMRANHTGGNVVITTTKIVIHGVPKHVTHEQLSATFQVFGKIEDCAIRPNNGIAFIQFSEVGDARNAFQTMHNTTPFGFEHPPLLVKLAETSEMRAQRRNTRTQNQQQLQQQQQHQHHHLSNFHHHNHSHNNTTTISTKPSSKFPGSPSHTRESSFSSEADPHSCRSSIAGLSITTPSNLGGSHSPTNVHHHNSNNNKPAIAVDPIFEMFNKEPGSSIWKDSPMDNASQQQHLLQQQPNHFRSPFSSVNNSSSPAALAFNATTDLKNNKLSHDDLQQFHLQQQQPQQQQRQPQVTFLPVLPHVPTLGQPPHQQQQLQRPLGGGGGGAHPAQILSNPLQQSHNIHNGLTLPVPVPLNGGNNNNKNNMLLDLQQQQQQQQLLMFQQQQQLQHFQAVCKATPGASGGAGGSAGLAPPHVTMPLMFDPTLAAAQQQQQQQLLHRPSPVFAGHPSLAATATPTAASLRHQQAFLQQQQMLLQQQLQRQQQQHPTVVLPNAPGNGGGAGVASASAGGGPGLYQLVPVQLPGPGSPTPPHQQQHPMYVFVNPQQQQEQREQR